MATDASDSGQSGSTGNEVRVVAVLRTAAGKGGELLAAWPSLAAQVRAEAGCIAYDLHRVVDDPDRFVVLERWASPEALRAHGQSEHMREFGTVAASFREGPSELHILEDVPAV